MNYQLNTGRIKVPDTSISAVYRDNYTKGLFMRKVVMMKSAIKYLDKQNRNITDKITAAIKGLQKEPMKGPTR